MNGRGRQFVYALVAFGVGLVLAALLSVPVLTAQIRTTQLEGTPTGKKLVAASERILDCTEAGSETEPAGDCYRRSQEQTAAILTSAQRIVILSAACAVDVDATQPIQARIQQITDCVTRRLSAPPQAPTPGSTSP